MCEREANKNTQYTWKWIVKWVEPHGRQEMNFKFPKDTHNADIKIIYKDQILWVNANVIFREYKRHIQLLKKCTQKYYKEVYQSNDKDCH